MVKSHRPSGVRRITFNAVGSARRNGGGTGSPVIASQTRAVPSSDPVATRRPSALNIPICTPLGWRIGFPIGCPVCAFHNCAVRSAEVESRRVPSGLNSAVQTMPLCRMGGSTNSSDDEECNRSPPSTQAVNIRLPSALKPGPKNLAGLMLLPQKPLGLHVEHAQVLIAAGGCQLAAI